MPVCPCVFMRAGERVCALACVRVCLFVRNITGMIF